jgi:hypothetical protein
MGELRMPVKDELAVLALTVCRRQSGQQRMLFA